jgi:hypothetical protein
VPAHLFWAEPRLPLCPMDAADEAKRRQTLKENGLVR